MANEIAMFLAFLIWTAAAFVWGMVYHRDHPYRTILYGVPEVLVGAKVTDLERFCLEQVWRPYQTKVFPDLIQRLETSPMSITETAIKLSEDTEWSRAVLSRIGLIGFHVPPYVVHPLAEIIRKTCDRKKDRSND